MATQLERAHSLPLSSAQWERGMFAKRKASLFSKKKICGEPRVTSVCSKALRLLYPLPFKRKPKHTFFFLDTHRPILSSLHASKCGCSAEMWYSPASFHPPPLTPLFPTLDFFSRDPYLPASGLEVEAHIYKYRSPDYAATAIAIACPPYPPGLQCAARGAGQPRKAGMEKGSMKRIFDGM